MCRNGLSIDRFPRNAQVLDEESVVDWLGGLAKAGATYISLDSNEYQQGQQQESGRNDGSIEQEASIPCWSVQLAEIQKEKSGSTAALAISLAPDTVWICSVNNGKVTRYSFSKDRVRYDSQTSNGQAPQVIEC